MKEFLKCPKFQNKNCPFKNATTIKELCEEMSKILVDTPDHQLALQVVFKAIHAASKSLEAGMLSKPALVVPSSLSRVMASHWSSLQKLLCEATQSSPSTAFGEKKENQSAC